MITSAKLTADLTVLILGLKIPENHLPESGCEQLTRKGHAYLLSQPCLGKGEPRVTKSKLEKFGEGLESDQPLFTFYVSMFCGPHRSQ